MEFWTNNSSKRGESLIIGKVQKSSPTHVSFYPKTQSEHAFVQRTREGVALYPPEFMRVSDKKGEMTPETPTTPLKEFHFRRRIQLGVSVFKVTLLDGIPKGNLPIILRMILQLLSFYFS